MIRTEETRMSNNRLFCCRIARVSGNISEKNLLFVKLLFLKNQFCVKFFVNFFFLPTLNCLSAAYFGEFSINKSLNKVIISGVERFLTNTPLRAFRLSSALIRFTFQVAL